MKLKSSASRYPGPDVREPPSEIPNRFFRISG
jgi:hypothetical protein